MTDATTAASDHVIVDEEALRDFGSRALQAAGVAADDAELSAHVLTRTHLRGVESHGIWFLKGYIQQALQGGINLDATARDVIDAGSIVVIDGDAGIGLAIAHRATTRAIERAKTAGVGIVAVRNSNHFGAAGHYALMCAEAGVIGLVFTNAPPVMAVTGSRTRAIGNNPIGFGAPRRDGAPVVLDVAMSLVAGGKTRMALERGEEVPLGWIVGADGEPTTNPADFLRNGGALLPLGDHKGYGLSFMAEILAGTLTGAGLPSEIVSWLFRPEQPSNTGHLVVALDVAAFMSADAFEERIVRLCEEMTSAPRREGADRILVPGEIEHEHEQRARAAGVSLRPEIWRSLIEVAERLELVGELEAIRRAPRP